MADDKNGKDSGDKTQQQPLRPPVPKPPQPDKAGASGEGEHTVMGGRPPAVPKPPAAPPAPAPPPPEAAPDRTVMAGGPPVMPKPTAPPAAAPSAPPPPPAPAAIEDEGATVILARATQGGCSLQRLQPPGHGADVVKLTQDSYVMGRSRACDIQLYSTTASRQHARLIKRGEGWYLEPEEGKAVIAGGSTVKGEVRLVHKMRLQLGGDELLFFDEGTAIAAPSAASATPSAAGEAKGSRTMPIVAIVVAVAAAAAVAAWLFLNP